MEGTLLKRMYLTGVVPGALGEYPQLDLLIRDLFRSGVEGGSRFLRVHSVDVNQTAQPGTQADRPCIEDFLFGNDGTLLHHWPKMEHPQYVQRALMIRHDYASPILLQVLPSSQFPSHT